MMQDRRREERRGERRGGGFGAIGNCIVSSNAVGAGWLALPFRIAATNHS